MCFIELTMNKFYLFIFGYSYFLTYFKVSLEDIITNNFPSSINIEKLSNSSTAFFIENFEENDKSLPKENLLNSTLPRILQIPVETNNNTSQTAYAPAFSLDEINSLLNINALKLSSEKPILNLKNITPTYNKVVSNVNNKNSSIIKNADIYSTFAINSTEESAMDTVIVPEYEVTTFKYDATTSAYEGTTSTYEGTTSTYEGTTSTYVETTSTYVETTATYVETTPTYVETTPTYEGTTYILQDSNINSKNIFKNNFSNCSVQVLELLTHKVDIKFSILKPNLGQQQLLKLFEMKLRQAVNEDDCNSVSFLSLNYGIPFLYSWTNSSLNDTCNTNSISSKIFNNSRINTTFVNFFLPYFSIENITIVKLGICVPQFHNNYGVTVTVPLIFVIIICICCSYGIYKLGFCRKRKPKNIQKQILRPRFPFVLDSDTNQFNRISRKTESFCDITNPSFQEEI